ncbi:hypothetical protein GGE45_001235 [Rhizobium aethiopicum]|uniref:Uncharacterized protein n=1 Tax=Rhizobium aethiopicum TaxID=1138170 RepID=A0A7W6MFT8_9HYPH|nr:hypothetical protein [Rhizobium aethiopicum]MBB4578921.1 hypothetical protein [Rhizobium aethiopicum]
MLRIQSLALRHVLNRRELHTCLPGEKVETPSPKTSVTSLDKRDRQSLFQRIQSLRSRKLRRPRFSFFSSSIVKEPTTPAVTKTRSKPKPEATNQQSPIRLSFLRARDFVASSAAALVQ